VECREISENVKIMRRLSGLDDDGGEGVEDVSGVEITAISVIHLGVE
jgi:hypothetical protein